MEWESWRHAGFKMSLFLNIVPLSSRKAKVHPFLSNCMSFQYFKPPSSDLRVSYVTWGSRFHMKCRIEWGMALSMAHRDRPSRHLTSLERLCVCWWAVEERWRSWKEKRIMLHIKRFIFLHGMVNTKRCLDAFIIGASFGCLCHCLLPKTNFKMHKNALFLPTSSELSRFSFINTDATNNLQNIQHTCNIHLQWGFHLGILHFSSIGVLLYHRKKK